MFNAEREAMVRTQLQERDIEDPGVLAAMGAVERHRFVPEPLWEEAYGDYPVPIGHRQTISQPYIVASMTQLLGVKAGSRVLEIGTGSGYQTAVLCALGCEVYSIEIVASLGRRAGSLLRELGYAPHLKVADGYFGWAEAAPFDGILLTAAPEKVPPPLLEQLGENGRLVAPVGDLAQELMVYQRRNGNLIRQRIYSVRFVPMTGRAERE